MKMPKRPSTQNEPLQNTKNISSQDLKMKKFDIRSAEASEVYDFIIGLGFEGYRSTQVFEWINKKFLIDFEQMSNLPQKMREILNTYAYISNASIIRTYETQNTKKYLFVLENNTIIENVLMKYSFGNTVCVSSQAGCKMGCVFCASASNGFIRNLTAGEMCAQVYEISKSLGQRINNIVLMGSGEPFDNYDNTVKFIRILTSPKGLNLGQRHITVSTCGIVPRIWEFAELGMQINLAVSLHAPDDDIRQKLMPVSCKYKIDEIIDACEYYHKKTGRRVTFEYALTAGLNDSPACADKLARKLRDSKCHVNLIPLNNIKTPRGALTGSRQQDIDRFAGILMSKGITTTIRRRLGSDINASCGQLSARIQKDQKSRVSAANADSD